MHKYLLPLQALLTPKVAPGQCFPLEGHSGWVDIQLHHPIELTGFTIEHIPSSIAYNVSSAPKTISLVGLTPPTTHLAKGDTFTPGKVHGPFKYDVNSNSAVQTFSIFASESEPVQHVRLQVGKEYVTGLARACSLCLLSMPASLQQLATDHTGTVMSH